MLGLDHDGARRRLGEPLLPHSSHAPWKEPKNSPASSRQHTASGAGPAPDRRALQNGGFQLISVHGCNTVSAAAPVVTLAHAGCTAVSAYPAETMRKPYPLCLCTELPLPALLLGFAARFLGRLPGLASTPPGSEPVDHWSVEVPAYIA